MNNFNSQFLYSVIIILLGYVLKRSAIIKEKDGEGLACLHIAFALFSGV